MDIILKQKIAELPVVPGVYLYKDNQGKIIYIGKAKSLKKRVSSYFNRFLSTKTQNLVSRIADIEYIVTPSEAQAQLLEAALIKDHQPFYNISLKDDKSFPVIRITDEDFPLISICRKRNIKEDKHAEYFGPYTNAQGLRDSLKVMRRIFGFRSCKTMPKEECLYCRLGLCPAPCIGKITSQEYKELVEQIKLFLGSRYEKLLYELTNKMRQASKEHNFEDAARIRDQINALSVFTPTPILRKTKKNNQLVWGCTQGRINSTGLNELEDLKNLLKLKITPQRIEGFDISNISGQEACGSMVSFYKGLPDKDNYRRFKIKLTGKIDDYAMLREVVFRRYQRLKSENLALPDLILIDGGKGHLLTAYEVIRELGLVIPMMSIAKEHEHIYVLGRDNPIKLKNDTSALNLIRRVRDEAHRFAVSYHHVLRRKKIIGK